MKVVARLPYNINMQSVSEDSNGHINRPSP